MSALIGRVEAPIRGSEPLVVVLASEGGVEMHADPTLSFDPIVARNLAALLVRASEEVERMRKAAP